MFLSLRYIFKYKNRYHSCWSIVCFSMNEIYLDGLFKKKLENRKEILKIKTIILKFDLVYKV